MVLGVGCVLAGAALAVFIGIAAEEWLRGLRVFVAYAVFWLAVLAGGPWLATRLRERQWPVRKEALALAATVVLAVAFALGAQDSWDRFVRAAIPTDSSRLLVFSACVGARIDGEETKEEEASRCGTGAAQPSALQDAVKLLANAGFLFWLGGGFALFRYFPQQRRLAEAQRRRELAAAQAARREAELKLEVLAAQVEPHFLFNTLAGVRGAVASDPQRAVMLIDRLSDYLRLTIPRLRADAQADSATLGAQLEIVEAYLSLIHARLPRLSYAMAALSELAAARFPPLMLISLAENAVKHGVEPKVGPVRIEVTAQRTGDALTVSVCDDGVGFSATGAGGGLGLANIRERLAQLYGERASLALTARAEGGICATISVPYEAAADADRDPR